MTAKTDRSSQLVFQGNNAVEIVSLTGETITIPSGAAGAVVEFQTAKFPIRDSNGGGLAGPGDTSLALTSTAFTNEVAFGTADADLSNGDYWINPVTGQGRGKKADSSTSMTADYKIAAVGTKELYAPGYENNASGRAEIEQPGTPFAISTATTTTVVNGSGHVNEIRVIGGTLGNVTIYDNIAGSGTVLLPTVTPVANGVLLKDIDFSTGLTIVTASATVIVGSVRAD